MKIDENVTKMIKIDGNVTGNVKTAELITTNKIVKNISGVPSR